MEREEGQSGRSEIPLAESHELHDSIEHPARSRAQSGLNRAN
jgi:hypothetical protein